MSAGWQRRARPLLGTLVEVGVAAPGGDDATTAELSAGLSAALSAAFGAAFAAVAEVQACMSRFDSASDVGRFHALPAGQGCRVRPATASVLRTAAALQRESGGLFDIAQGSAPAGWRIEGRTWWRLDAAARVDLGGIAKGYAVDRAVIALRRHGCAGGWVNAGGDLRAFGSAELPLQLRDEVHGGVRRFGRLADGAFATSRLPGGGHVSVAAPRALWADALTKVLAFSGDPGHPLLARHGAQGFLH